MKLDIVEALLKVAKSLAVKATDLCKQSEQNNDKSKLKSADILIQVGNAIVEAADELQKECYKGGQNND